MDLNVPALPRVAADAATTAATAAPMLTLSVWLDYLHGAAAELAFWCAVIAAIGGAVRVCWDLWDRAHRTANRAPAHDLDGR